jgi:TolB-like protein/tetratricopeptide (TPR) repeat protein
MAVSSAVFLSYASEDADAAGRVCEALRSAGIEVWFDRSDMHGGDAWDRKIRQQIKDCALFLAIVSANSQARLEGYFRREWWLAVERTHEMADGRHFLLPVVIDQTTEADALVPEAFRAVQWTRLNAGEVSPAFAGRIASLLPLYQPMPKVAADSRVAPTMSRPASTPKGRRDPDHSQFSQGNPRPTRLALGVIVLVVVGALALAGYFLSTRTAPVAPIARNDSGPSAPPEAAERPRIAVLPFENLSPDPNNAFFTDGMHEEILTALANDVPGLDVISRTTMDTYKGKAVTAQALSKELHCNYVLEGSMRREGNEARLALQLIDARGDRHVWAQDFDRKLVNIMALESEVAAAVAVQISSKLQSAFPTSAGATNPTAFDLYLKARAAEENAGDYSPLGEWQAVQAQLDQALKLDPDFTRAYVERIGVRVSLFIFNHDPAGATLAAAHQDLETAKRLAPRDPLVTSAEAVLGYAEKDYDRSLRLFEAAENSGLSDSRMSEWKGKLLFAMGRYQQAAALDEQLFNLDPKNEVLNDDRWFALMELHQPQAAMRAAALRSDSTARARVEDVVRSMFAGDKASFERENEWLTTAPLDTPQNIDVNLAQFVLSGLQYLGRFREAREVIDKANVTSVRGGPLDWPARRIGRFPVADLRGWFDLLLGDVSEARRDGQGILNFLRHEPETKWNKWFRTLLLADAQLLAGNADQAIATADNAIALTRADVDVSDQMNAVQWATQIRAWAGAKEQAVAGLDTLSTSIPGLWPGEIVIDPVWRVPLAGNESYKRLCARIDAQMKAVRF